MCVRTFDVHGTAKHLRFDMFHRVDLTKRLKEIKRKNQHANVMGKLRNEKREEKNMWKKSKNVACMCSTTLPAQYT